MQLKNLSQEKLITIVTLITLLLITGIAIMLIDSILHPKDLTRYISLWNDPYCAGKSLCIVRPQAEDTMCWDKNFDILWIAPPNSLVTVSIREPDAFDDGGFYTIGTFPASSPELNYPGHGHYAWHVGDVEEKKPIFRAGYGYTMQLVATTSGQRSLQVLDRERLFALTKCE